MMRVLCLVILILFSIAPCLAENVGLAYEEDLIILPNVYINDTSYIEDEFNPDSIMLKGYAEFLEDSEAIYLKDDDNQLVLNLKIPQKITSKNYTYDHKKYSYNKHNKNISYSKYGGAEYKIAPTSRNAVVSSGGLSFGTIVDEEVDYAELEHTATFFTKYKKDKFAFTTAYERTIGSTYNNYIDTVYIAPEVKINKFLSVKEILSDNRTYNRKKAEVVLSIDPLANTKENRLNFEFGASRTYYGTSNFIRDRIRFSTKFKL